MNPRRAFSGARLARCVVVVSLWLGLTTAATAAMAATDASISSQALDITAPPTTRAALAAVKPVAARHAMVVTAQHLATQVGVDILKRGGNAVDAAVAVGYALAVVHPCCGNIGGGGFMVIHLAHGRHAGENLFLDFREKAPLAATSTMFQDAHGNVVKGRSTKTFLAIGVPGTVMGLNTALADYGTLPLKTVIAPAIRLARRGYVLTPGDVKILDGRVKTFRRHANVARTFLHDGQPWKVGDRLRQRQLARTLEHIRDGGTAAFYRGGIARAVVAASKAHGGLLTMDDFANYSVQWDAPVTCGYHGVTVVSDPPPSSGGTTICETLLQLAPYPMGRWGYGSVDSVHHIVEAERRAFADRNRFLGDPAFIHNPIARLLSPAHIDALRATIRDDHATPSSDIHAELGAEEGRHTTQYSVVDAQGDAVSVTYTINYLFGLGQIAGDTGFFLNNEMDDFTAKPGVPNSFGLVQGTANEVAPGKRPLSSMSPSIVLKHGKLLMVTGSPGGSTIISTTLDSILNIVDFGMNAQQAVNAPRLHEQWLPDIVFVEPGLLTPEVQRKLEAMGHHFKVMQSWGADEAIVVDPQTRMRYGANDRRRPAGLAAGY